MTREQYALAWEAYRNAPSLKTVQETIGCGADVARRLVYTGLPKLSLPGMEKRLMDENRLAVAGEKKLQVSGEKLDALTAAKRLEAQKEAAASVVKREVEILGDAERQRADELKLVRANRQSALALAGVGANLLRSAHYLSTHYVELLEETERKGLKGAAAFKNMGMKPKEAMLHLRAISNVSQRVAEVSRNAVEMERLMLGEPTSILGVQGGSLVRPKTQEEALEMHKRASKAFQRFQARTSSTDAVVESEETEE